MSQGGGGNTAPLPQCYTSQKAQCLVHVPNFGGLSGSEDRGGGDNSIQFINIGRVVAKFVKNADEK